MKYVLVCCICFLNILSIGLSTAQKNTLERISQKVKIDSTDLILLYFYNIGDCVACFNQVETLKKILLDTIKSQNLKSITVVNLNRDKDLNTLKDNIKIDLNTTINKAKLVRDEYALGDLDNFIIINDKGELLYKVNIIYLEKKFNQELDKLIQMINMYLKTN